MKKLTAFLFNKQRLAISAIVILAIAIRFFKLGSVPIELNRDEASLGYTAYSLLMTGKEEHGTAWPIEIESFGDWKLPLYVYTLIPFIKVFGLTAWTVRLPSALAGVSVVVSSYFLIGLLFAKQKYREQLQLLVPLILAVSPWAVHFSHVAYEAHLAMSLFLWGLVALLTVLRDFAEGKSRIGLLVFSQFLWALTLLGYHAYQVFTPLFWLLMVWLYWPTWQRFFAKKRRWLLFAAIPFLLAGGLLLGSGVGQANSTKFSGLSILDLHAYTDRVNHVRQTVAHPNNPIFVLASNKLGALFVQIESNFLQLISPEFLFLQGGANHAHNITGFGNFYPIMFFGLAAGLYYLFTRPQVWQKLLGGWLLAASVAPMLTFQANHTIRFSPAYPAIEILSVYGIIKLLQLMHKYLSKKLLLTLVFMFIMGLSYNVYRFLVNYYYYFPTTDASYWSWQMKTLVYWLNNQRTHYDAIYFQDESYSPYIYFLFYEPGNPAELAQRIEYYPIDEEGFRHVQRLDNIYFQHIDWSNQELIANKNVLFITEEYQIPDYNRFNEHYRLLTTLHHPGVAKGIEIWEYLGKTQQIQENK